VWTAARAAQRGFTSVRNLTDALEVSGVQRFLADPMFLDTTCDRFEQLHKIWCTAIASHLNSLNINNVTYGRSAKLLAVYLKSMVVVGGSAHSSLAHCIHPPIDRRLLQALAADPKHKKADRAVWRTTNWTQLNEDKYYNLVRQLRNSMPPEIPFWMIEEYWTASDDED